MKIDRSKLLCVCGHNNGEHTKSNKKVWDRLNTQLKGYKDTPKNREEFWLKFLKGTKPDEFRCSYLNCECQEFRQDNLKYVEQKYEEKNK